jgi:hypothetical protein
MKPTIEPMLIESKITGKKILIIPNGTTSNLINPKIEIIPVTDFYFLANYN